MSGGCAWRPRRSGGPVGNRDGCGIHMRNKGRIRLEMTKGRIRLKGCESESAGLIIRLIIIRIGHARLLPPSERARWPLPPLAHACCLVVSVYGALPPLVPCCPMGCSE